VRQAAAALGEDWDVEILEMHHRMKVDAPSGTALLLGRRPQKGGGSRWPSVRCGFATAKPARGPRAASASPRSGGGTVVGEHGVIFAGPHERIELTHRAEDRGLFARGAVRAALWAQAANQATTPADVLRLDP
jgi:4-hydroxy-tetrahydrodipicolinate reductase